MTINKSSPVFCNAPRMCSDFIPKKILNWQAPAKIKIRISAENMDGSVHVEVGSQRG